MGIAIASATLLGIYILYLAIKREIEKKVNHVDLCDKHYKGDL